MTLERLNATYGAARALSTRPDALEVWSVTDPAGASYNASLRRLLFEIAHDDPESWQSLLAPARALLWRLATEPMPEAWAQRESLIRLVAGSCDRARQASNTSTQVALESLGSSADALLGDEIPAVASVLVESIQECGGAPSVFTSGRAALQASRWFEEADVNSEALTTSQLMAHDVVEQVFLVGPPRFFGRRPVVAPRSECVTFLVPHWVRDQAVPRSQFAGLTPSAYRAKQRARTVGEPPDLSGSEISGDESQQLTPPSPVWRKVESRPPRVDEVSAKTVLLTGGFAMYLDQEGEHIRALDPSAPPGERVQQTRVAAVTRGTFLLLREGASESEVLYDRALALMGRQGPNVEASQQRWKDLLAVRLRRDGRSQVVRELERRGVSAASRAPAWTARTLASPQSQSDFELLLAYLGLALDPYVANAQLVRRMRGRAVAEIREALEREMSQIDAKELTGPGFLMFDLDAEGEGAAGLFATRVLAVSPEAEPVQRREVRKPFRAEVPSWLE